MRVHLDAKAEVDKADDRVVTEALGGSAGPLGREGGGEQGHSGGGLHCTGLNGHLEGRVLLDAKAEVGH